MQLSSKLLWMMFRKSSLSENVGIMTITAVEILTYCSCSFLLVLVCLCWSIFQTFAYARRRYWMKLMSMSISTTGKILFSNILLIRLLCIVVCGVCRCWINKVLFSVTSLVCSMKDGKPWLFGIILFVSLANLAGMTWQGFIHPSAKQDAWTADFLLYF